MSTGTVTTTTTTDTMFEQASRFKLRFDSPKGLLTTEDLWDLPLTSPSGNRAHLDAIAMSLYRQTRDAAEVVSFVNPTAESREKSELELRLAIVKHVIDVKLAERDALQAAAERRDKKQRLLELIARKQDEELSSKPIEELQALVNSL
jgi:hypothetical protein